MLSKTSRYGVRAVLFIATNTDETHLLGIKELSKKIEISTPMLSKVLQYLTRKEIIESKKGRNGGFFMTTDQKNRHLMHVIQELEQSQYLITACMMGQKNVIPVMNALTTKGSLRYDQNSTRYITQILYWRPP